MKEISLKRIIPQVFADAGELNSGIWNTTVEFNKGTSYLIKAESGKGKSSLCSYIYGYRNDYQGALLFDDNDIKNFPIWQWDKIRRQEISFLFQDLFLFPELTSLENVMLKNNLTQHKTESQIKGMFETLNIEHKMNDLCSKMSLGQQQRVAAIRCLCQPFDFILADEPISHLDDVNAENLANLLQFEAKQQGAGIIITSIGRDLPLAYNQIITL